MTNIDEAELVNQGGLPPDDFHEYIERIREVADYNLEVPQELLARLTKETSDLLVDSDLLTVAATAIKCGHIVIQGPPGTGKSSLARAICRAFHCEAIQATAHEDWSVFEVVGRQSLQVTADGKEHIVPVNGVFTEAAIQCANAIVRHSDSTDEPQAAWLIVDELNRAQVDRAFGELFTILGTDELVPITLLHQRDGNNELVTPKRFRIIATLNSIDRQFVNGLGQGLKRRFTFLTLDIPKRRKANESWGSSDTSASAASKEFSVVIRRAAKRVADRETSSKDELLNLLNTRANPSVVSFFNLVEKLRYAEKGSGTPYIPVGTAQLIDVVELFLERLLLEHVNDTELGEVMDWSASVKLTPLFDTDTISPTDLEQFADSLSTPFDHNFKRELQQIVAAGQYYVV